MVLPPTRSTARARARLAGLPGGGGTPLALGLDAAAALAGQVKRTGQTPFVVLMTDGRANVARTARAGARRRWKMRSTPGGGCSRPASPRSPSTRPPRRVRARPRTWRGSPRRWARRASPPGRRFGRGQRGGARFDIEASGAGPMIFGPAPLAFERDGRDWPNREASAFVDDARRPLARAADGRRAAMSPDPRHGRLDPFLRGADPLLAARFDVIAPDLVGHGFTRTERSPDLSLPGMARAVAGASESARLPRRRSSSAIRRARPSSPACASTARSRRRSSSASTAPSCRSRARPRYLFPSIAKLLFVNPLAPRLFAWAADRKAVENLIRGTGSKLDARGLDLYARLLGNAAHVGGALGMMANWDLATMRRDLPKLKPKVVLIVGDNDKAVSPGDAAALAREIPGAVGRDRHGDWAPHPRGEAGGGRPT